MCYFSDAFCSVEFITFQRRLAQTSGYVSAEFISFQIQLADVIVWNLLLFRSVLQL